MDTRFPTVVWRLCLGLGFAITVPSLAGVSGVCVLVRVLVSRHHSWLGLGLGFVLQTAIPDFGFGACVVVCTSACTPPFLAPVCGVGVCAWARVSAAPLHPWPGCWGLCVFVCALLLYPANPGWGVRYWCVRLGSGFGCGSPLLAGVLGSVCLCARSACTPPLLAVVYGLDVCGWARVLAAPRHSWLGC